MLPSDLEWDKERLGDLYDPLTDRGAPIAEAVIRAVCTDLASCPSVAALSNYLRKKFLLNLADYQTLSKEDAVQLNIILSKASGERMGRGRFLVRDLILSLFDLGLEQFDMWCHSMAFVLREKAIEKLNLSDHLKLTQVTNFSDVTVPDIRVPLSEQTTAVLLKELNLYERPTELKGVLELCRTRGKTVCDVVRAMMVTPGLGRHVSKLLPFYQSYPWEVLQFLKKLGSKWVEFAKFIGFKQDEVEKLLDIAPKNTIKQIQNFSKVWRMPDLTSRKNDDVLDEVLKKARITTDDVVPDTSVPQNTTHFTICSPGAISISVQTQQSFPPTTSVAGDLQNDERSRQDTGSSDYSRDDDMPLTQQTRLGTAPNDNIESLTESEPYERLRSASSDFSEPWSTPSNHPTSTPAIEALPQGRDYRPEFVMPPQQLPPERAPEISTDGIAVPKLCLGRGLYGEVHVCKLEGCADHREYAAKIYHCQSDMDEMKQIYTDKLRSITHPNVVSYFGVCHLKCDTQQPAFVMERLVKNLAKFLETPDLKLQLHQKCSILLDMANGLEYLHKKGIIHCDLTAQNVLVTADSRAKIADYANSLVKRLAELEVRTRTECLEYLPEEARQENYDESVDVFAFSHLSLYVILQHKPYSLGPRTLRVKGNLRPIPVSEVDRRKDSIATVSEKLKRTKLFVLVEHIVQCFSDEASERPTIAHLVSVLNGVLVNWNT